MLSRLIIGLVAGGSAALLLVSSLLITSTSADIGDLPMVLIGACVFAGIGLSLAAENTRRAIGLPLVYVGLAGAGASVVGHLAALDLLFMDLTTGQRLMARMGGSIALAISIGALLAAYVTLNARRRLSFHTAHIQEDREHLNGINAFIDSDIRGWLATHERDLCRANRPRLLILGLGLPLTVAAILTVTAIYRPLSPPLWMTALLAIVALGLYCIAFAPRLSAPTSARNMIIGRLCGFFGLRHNGEGNGLELSPFRRLLLVPRYHRTRLDNVLWGRVAGQDVFIAEATLQARTNRLTPLAAAYRTNFHGILMCVRLGIGHSGELVMMTPKRHHDLAQRGIKRPLADMVTGDPALDRVFRCQASHDAIVGRALSDTVRRQMLDLVGRVGKNRIQFAISDDAIYISLATPKRWFGGARSTDFIGVGEIRRFVEDIRSVWSLAHISHDVAKALQREQSAEQRLETSDTLPSEYLRPSLAGQGFSAA